MNSTRHLALAALIPLATFALQLALWEYIDPYVWFLFYPAVFFAAVLTGLQGGILATVMSTLLVWYAFIPVRYSFALEAPHALISIVAFAVTGIIFSVFCERARRTTQRLAAQQSEAKLTSVLDNAADAVLIVNRDQRFIYANEQASKQLGYTVEELLKLGMADVTRAAEHALAEANFQKLLHEHQLRLEMRLLCKDGCRR
jgi:two-component system sensor histidine kinase/response regulator